MNNAQVRKEFDMMLQRGDIKEAGIDVISGEMMYEFRDERNADRLNVTLEEERMKNQMYRNSYD